MDVNDIYEKLVTAGEDWADKDAAASLKEETKKTLIAQLKTVSKAGSDAAREMEALASEGFKEHVRDMIEARKQANKAKVGYDAIKIWIELYRTKSATERAEMMLR